MNRLRSAIINDTITLKVKPNAKKTEILSIEEKVVSLAVAAPPEDNKANREILKFLSRILKKQVRLARGATCKTKVVKILD